MEMQLQQANYWGCYLKLRLGKKKRAASAAFFICANKNESGRGVLHVSPDDAVGNAVQSSPANCYIAYKEATVTLPAEVDIIDSAC